MWTKHRSTCGKFSILCCSRMPQSWLSRSSVRSSITTSSSTRKRGPKWYALSVSRLVMSGSCVSAISRTISRKDGSAARPMICSTCPRPCAAQRAAMYDVSASAAAASTHHSPADSCVTMSASRAPTERTTSFWLSASTARTVSVEVPLPPCTTTSHQMQKPNLRTDRSASADTACRCLLQMWASPWWSCPWCGSPAYRSPSACRLTAIMPAHLSAAQTTTETGSSWPRPAG
mmetsp:Transcript_8887/g.29473  ORF Transcript_8887/g.29473 Transcript_8887/m.29473 type:complete len:232 (+) Transcript_8887:414-1109(+)